MPLLVFWKKKENYFKLGKQIITQVEFEIGQIDHLLEAYADLFAQAQQTQPGLVETTALASVLHSFYNGLENIFLAIAKGVDVNVPSGHHWHRRLLTQMTEAMPDRAPVLKVDTAHRLADYLGFRHFYRHSYSYFLDWAELEKLVLPLAELWQQVKAELELFVKNMKQALTS